MRGRSHWTVTLLFAVGVTVTHGLEVRARLAAGRMHEPRWIRRSPAPHASSICDAEGWPALQAELDQLPVFLLANPQGEPLQHNGPNGEPTIVFFADLFRAEAELANTNRLYPDLGLELLPCGMGDAFRRVQAGNAMIIPSQNELAAAGLDPEQPNTVPLFGCTKIMQPRRSNPDRKAMPLFVSSSDARAALDAALNASGLVVPEGMAAQGVGLDILAITLQKACELIVSGQETRFEFFAPMKSLEWLTEYEERGSGEDGSGEDTSEKQAMFETLIDQRQAMLRQTGGVIPQPSSAGAANEDAQPQAAPGKSPQQATTESTDGSAVTGG